MHATQFLTSLKNIDPQKLADTKGLGEVLIKNLTEFTTSDRFDRLMAGFAELESAGKGLDVVRSSTGATIQGVLTEQVICITGTFPDTSRPNIKAELEKVGAKVVDSVTKATTILVCGAEAGSKLQKAEKLGIRIVEDWRELLT